MEILDQLAHKHDTDKKSGHHGYTAHYERWFGQKRNEVKKVLEIGVGQGASLRMWEEYFPVAQIFAIDSNPECVRHQTPRITVLVADQGRPEDLAAVIEKIGVDFDVIIDDGGHFMNQQIASFQTLFPAVRRGGVYVVEDLCTSYWESYSGGSRNTKGTTVSFLKHLVDDVNKCGIGIYGDHERALQFAREQGHDLSEYAIHIASIQFFPSIAFVERR